MNRYRFTIIMLLIVSAYTFIFHGKEFYFTAFKGGQEYNQGTAALEKEHYDKAIEFLKKAIRKNPILAEAYLNLGFAYAKTDQKDDARNQIQTAIELLKNGRHIETKDQFSIEQKLSNAYKNLALLIFRPMIDEFIQDAQPAKVLEYHELMSESLRNAQHYSTNPSVIQKNITLIATQKSFDIATSHYNLAAKNMEKNDYRLAVQNLNDALEIKPDYSEALILLGIIYQSANESDLSIKNYEKALEIQPEEIRILNTLAKIYGKKGEFKKGIDFYLRSIKISPEQSGTIYNIAVFLQASEQNQTAIEYFKKYIIMNPGAEDISEVKNRIEILSSPITELPSISQDQEISDTTPIDEWENDIVQNL